mmetsp:Transcript_128386/g.411511  ORF Transcript_128386/g.411511 Transcript_128386/m.411511 type:complete len:556 (-) Transcript_128386:335-2002(-)
MRASHSRARPEGFGLGRFLAPEMLGWVSFCACAMCELIAGQVYGFGLFSDVLRREHGLNLSQANVESVALSENLGQYARFLAGPVFDYYGAKATMRIGFLLNAAGYLAIYAAASLAGAGDTEAEGWRAPTTLLCIFAAMYGQGAGWVETAAISTAVKNFPEEAVGLLKTFFGIASAVGATAFAAAFAPSRVALLLAFGLLPLVVGLPITCLVGGSEMAKGKDKPSLHEPWKAAYGVTFMLALVLTGHGFVASTTSLLRPYEEHRVPNMVVFGIVLGLLAVLPTLPRHVVGDAGSSVKQSRSPPIVVADCGFKETLRSRNFWCLLFSLAAGEGAGLMVLNNMGQLVKALDGGNSDLQPVCVSAFSVSNALGRLCMGQLAVSAKLRRRQLLAGVLFLTSIAYSVFASADGRIALLVAMPVLGFLYGCLWSLQPLMAVELFGKKEYGSKYAALSLAAFVGAAPLCRIIVPLFYDAYADSKGWCVGAHCFRGSLFAAGLQCVVGMFLAVCLDDTARWQKVPQDETPVASSSEAIPQGYTTSPKASQIPPLPATSTEDGL